LIMLRPCKSRSSFMTVDWGSSGRIRQTFGILWLPHSRSSVKSISKWWALSMSAASAFGSRGRYKKPFLIQGNDTAIECSSGNSGHWARHNSRQTKRLLYKAYLRIEEMGMMK
jgi:hypothetical protein